MFGYILPGKPMTDLLFKIYVFAALVINGPNSTIMELRTSELSLHNSEHTERLNGFLSRVSGTKEDLETALHYVFQGSDLSNSGTLADSNRLDGLSRVSAHLSTSYEPRFMGFPASDRITENLNSSHGFFSDSLSKGSATWPEEKLSQLAKQSLSSIASSNYDILNTAVSDTIQNQTRVAGAAAWGLVIVTAGRGGEIRSFQNYGLPVCL